MGRARAFRFPLLALAVAVVPSGDARGAGAGKGDAARHLIYLHGRIVQEEQSARPVSPKFGPYELDAIVEALRGRGFEVHSAIRPKAATLEESADRIVAQVKELRASGLPLERITVVGASMGASIALLAAVKLGEPQLRVVAVGACRSGNVAEIAAEQEAPLRGRILFVRESSDDLGGPCPPWKDDMARAPDLVAEEVVVETGLSHGFLYRPLPEWVDPAVAWAAEAKLPKR